MIVTIEKPRKVKIFQSNGSLLRTICCTRNVSAAYINGDEVNVQFEDGSGAIYKLNGSIVRYFR